MLSLGETSAPCSTSKIADSNLSLLLAAQCSDVFSSLSLDRDFSVLWWTFRSFRFFKLPPCSRILPVPIKKTELKGVRGSGETRGTSSLAGGCAGSRTFAAGGRDLALLVGPCNGGEHGLLRTLRQARH